MAAPHHFEGNDVEATSVNRFKSLSFDEGMFVVHTDTADAVLEEKDIQGIPGQVSLDKLRAFLKHGRFVLGMTDDGYVLTTHV